jgi:hypothetical protein
MLFRYSGCRSVEHRHGSRSAVISVTVLEEATRSQVISENVSETEPARLLAVCVVNTDETRLTTPSGG